MNPTQALPLAYQGHGIPLLFMGNLDNAGDGRQFHSLNSLL
jgi:hypothetical protein